MNPRPPLPMAQCPWESLSKMLDVVLVLSAREGGKRKFEGGEEPRRDYLAEFTNLLLSWAPKPPFKTDTVKLQQFRRYLKDPSVREYISKKKLNTLIVDPDDSTIRANARSTENFERSYVSDKKTLLQMAASSKNNVLLLELLQLRAFPNILSTLGSTPLHSAIKSENDKGIEYLLRYHASMKANKEGDHELHLIAKQWKVYQTYQSKDENMVSNIRTFHNKDYFNRETNGWSSVDIEKVKKCLLIDKVIQDLLRHGADLYATDKDSHTPIEVAIDPYVKNILQQYDHLSATYTNPPRAKVPNDDPSIVHQMEAWKQYIGYPHTATLLLDDYSVRCMTLAHIADIRDKQIIAHHISQDTRDTNFCILDGMCGSGFDSMSFIKNFPNGYIISNEVDEERFYFMKKNTKQLLEHSTALHRIRNGDLLHLIEKPDTQVADPLFWYVQLLYLDPTWKHASYYEGKRTEEVHETSSDFAVGNISVEEAAQRAFEANTSREGRLKDNLQCVLIKLPFNYDKRNLESLKNKGYNCTVHSVFLSDHDDPNNLHAWQEKQIFVAVQRVYGETMFQSHFIYKGAHWLPPHDWEQPKAWRIPSERHEAPPVTKPVERSPSPFQY